MLAFPPLSLSLSLSLSLARPFSLFLKSSEAPHTQPAHDVCNIIYHQPPRPFFYLPYVVMDESLFPVKCDRHSILIHYPFGSPESKFTRSNIMIVAERLPRHVMPAGCRADSTQSRSRNVMNIMGEEHSRGRI